VNAHHLWKTDEVVARDGDGWVECSCSSRHWGLHGAAGLLISRSDSLLMQHRAPWVHNGDTWGIPGGARDSHENWVEAALREANEEIGALPPTLEVLAQFADDHLTWSYITVITKIDEDFTPLQLNHESLELRWMKIEEVESLNLHQSFARTWPDLKALIKKVI
jgi:8-oxo-dGTP diphosphatase